MGNIRKACARRIESGHRTSKLQSAMEYLMTYGWAILIIAIVLVALFSLGVFNSANFAPKAPPGACQVFRPNGPGTTFDLNLEGECNGELPQYATNFQSSSDYVSVANPSYMPTKTDFTLSSWVYDLPGYASWETVVETNEFDFERMGGYGTILRFVSGIGGGASSSGGIPVGRWNYFVVTINSTATKIYVNGTLIATGSGGSNTISISAIRFGEAGLSGLGGSDQWYGYLANIQIYNTSISANDINTLYNEGIGGAPIDLQNLVGWWPLNGNANDYSGNQNNGVATNLVYTTSWASSYTPP